jgi:hypothetical protein
MASVNDDECLTETAPANKQITCCSACGSKIMEEAYWPNGNLKSRKFLLNGRQHNPNGPAFEEWYEDGRNKTRVFRVNGELHNLNGPAFEEWYEDGRIKTRAFWVDGERHNLKGPAWEEWYEDGSHMQTFCIHGQWHNTLGPALEIVEKDGRVRVRRFFIHNHEITEDAFLAREQTKSAGKQ